MSYEENFGLVDNSRAYQGKVSPYVKPEKSGELEFSRSTIDKKRGESNGQEERPAANAGDQEQGKRDNILPEVHEEHKRRVGIEQQGISTDPNAPVNLRDACKEGRGIVHYPEGYKTEEYSIAKEIASYYGLDVVPILDQTKSVDAFLNHGAIFLNMDFSGLDAPIENKILHEISHHLHNNPINQTHPQKYRHKFRCLQAIQGNISRVNYTEEEFNNGMRLPVSYVVEEYAAELEAGLKSDLMLFLLMASNKGETLSH
jgi:hypothetical protein